MKARTRPFYESGEMGLKPQDPIASVKVSHRNTDISMSEAYLLPLNLTGCGIGDRR